MVVRPGLVVLQKIGNPIVCGKAFYLGSVIVDMKEDPRSQSGYPHSQKN